MSNVLIKNKNNITCNIGGMKIKIFKCSYQIKSSMCKFVVNTLKVCFRRVIYNQEILTQNLQIILPLLNLEKFWLHINVKCSWSALQIFVVNEISVCCIDGGGHQIVENAEWCSERYWSKIQNYMKNIVAEMWNHKFWS